MSMEKLSLLSRFDLLEMIAQLPRGKSAVADLASIINQNKLVVVVALSKDTSMEVSWLSSP